MDELTRQTEAFIAALAAVLHDLRMAKGWSLTELSTRSGLSQPSIGYIEQGKRRPTLDSLSRLAISLETTVSAISAAAEKRTKR